MSEKVVREFLKDLVRERMKALIEAIATPKRVAVLQLLVDVGRKPVRHKFLAKKFMGRISGSEISRILFKLVKAGLVVKTEDGSFQATELGEVVSTWIRLSTLYGLKDDPTARPYLRESLGTVLQLLNIPVREEREGGGLASLMEEVSRRFVEKVEEELRREREERAEVKRSALDVVLDRALAATG